MNHTLPKDNFTDHSANAITLSRVIDQHGYSSKCLFDKYGVNLDELHYDSRFKGGNLQPVWEEMSETIGDHLGILFAEQFQPGSYHGLSFAMAASKNLLDAFDRLARYFRVIANVGLVEVKSYSDKVKICLSLPVPTGIAQNASIDAALALFLKQARFAMGTSISPLQVHLQRPIPKNAQYFDHFFSCPIDYDNNEDCLIFSHSALTKPLPAANILLAKANDQVMDNYLKVFGFDNFSSTVSVLILNLLPSGEVSQSKIAALMNMSVRTLQRKLKHEDIGFHELIEETRMVLAKQYLEQTWRSIGEITYLLGYTEPSNFSRAFKRSTGLTPGVYRQKMTL